MTTYLLIDKHLNCIGKLLNNLYKKFENVVLIGDFKSEMAEDAMQDFCSSYNLKNLVNMPTCFKNVDHPSCIDLGPIKKTLVYHPCRHQF